MQNLKFYCKDRRLLFYMSRTLHLFGTDWCAMMVPIQVIRWYRMQCYDGTDSCAIVVPNRRYCHVGVEGLSTIAIFQVYALLKLVVAVRLVAMNLFKLTAEVVRIGNLLLVWINHL